MSCPLEPGDRIRLDRMTEDSCPIPEGTTGTVRAVSGSIKPGEYRITVDWDIDRSLALLWPLDEVTVLEGASE